MLGTVEAAIGIPKFHCGSSEKLSTRIQTGYLDVAWTEDHH